ncbi:hypothetical protein GDO81_020719 [Engystomops pustulosus]|uniref:Uncharacterized protein n=1 Tax=Engystomops pustulosus TaxID=76066 RepID=A0AAV6ZI22_ENGPU|nr:hypothetical protein GDO81_020719 [Engystomops pustulosus]
MQMANGFGTIESKVLGGARNSEGRNLCLEYCGRSECPSSDSQFGSIPQEFGQTIQVFCKRRIEASFQVKKVTSTVGCFFFLNLREHMLKGPPHQKGSSGPIRIIHCNWEM